jgi:hypothetical protein
MGKNSKSRQCRENPYLLLLYLHRRTWFKSLRCCTVARSILTRNRFSTVDPSQSTSFADIEPGAFSIEYHDGSQVLGDFITDNMEISDVTISSLEMGLANSASGFANKGFMGVGFDTNEAEAATSVYPNIIDDMVSQGLIGGRFYSLWLDDLG